MASTAEAIRHDDALLTEARGEGCEFGPTLANHLPMVLVALRRLGASADRQRAFAARYRVANPLAPPPPPVAPVDAAGWTLTLGRRERETDLRAFFQAELARVGAVALQRRCLPVLLPGIAASALHALMRLAYGHMESSEAEIATALAYWTATYLEIPAGAGVPQTDDVGEVLARLRALPHLRAIVPETDLLWHAMRAVGQDPRFAAELDRLHGCSLPRAAAAALALDVAAADFCSLHAVTSVHWLRLLPGEIVDRPTALRHLWRALAAAYPKMGMPELPSAAALAAMRQAPCPDWTAIAAAAIASDDEHDISLVFSAREEERHWDEPLYRRIAARRMGLL